MQNYYITQYIIGTIILLYYQCIIRGNNIIVIVPILKNGFIIFCSAHTTVAVRCPKFEYLGVANDNIEWWACVRDNVYEH